MDQLIDLKNVDGFTLCLRKGELYYPVSVGTKDYSKTRTEGRDTIAIGAGTDCIVSAGENGCFASAWYDPVRKRNLIKVGYVGRRGIKAETPYKLTQYGQWEEVK